MAEASVIRTSELDEAGKEPREARRRRELIEATITSIARFGLSSTTVARVAKLAGCSTGIVNFYFKSKSALLLATLEHVNAEFGRVQRETLEGVSDDHPAEQLAALIDVAFDPDVASPSRIAVWNAFWGEAATRADYMKVCGRREDNEERTVVGLFNRLAKIRGSTHLDATALGRAFYQLLTTLPDDMLDLSTPFDFDGARATCHGFLRSIFPLDFADSSEDLSDRKNTSAPNLRRITRSETTAEPETDALPNWVYHDPEFHQLEVEHIFKANWLLVGHVSHVPAPGDYMTLDAVGERVLVIRDREGNLRAMPNVCRHRASRVVRGDTGHCSSKIRCPYHGWTYDFDGSLRGVPGEETFKDLDRSSRGLPAIELEEWMGFVFIRFKGEGPSVADSMQPFAEEASHFRFSELKPWGSRSSTTHDFNWKVFAENDAEWHHIPASHPGLRRLFGPTYKESAPDLQNDALGRRAFAALQEKKSSNWTEGHYQKLLPEVEHLPEYLQRAWIYYGIYPTTVIQISPELVECYSVQPVGPDRSRLIGFSLAHEDDRPEMKVARYLNSRITRQALIEDLEICHWSDEGIRSDSYSGSELSTLASGVNSFQQRLRELIPVARCQERPRAGEVAAKNAEMRLKIR